MREKGGAGLDFMDYQWSMESFLSSAVGSRRKEVRPWYHGVQPMCSSEGDT